MLQAHRRAAGVVMAATMTLFAAQPAMAEPNGELFKGKTVTYIVATAAGGGFDFYARLIAPEMERHLPGSTIIVRNMPGAGHLVGANFIAAAKPDGLTIGTFSTGLIYNQLVGLSGVKFDLTTMSWIGKASSDPRVVAVGTASPIKSFEGLRNSKSAVKFALAGVGSGAYVETMILKNAFNLPIQMITGYNGNGDMLAIRRGEVDAKLGSLSTLQAFADEGHARLVVQIGGREKAAPQLASFATDSRTRELTALIQSQGELSRFTVGPAAIPAGRLDALRAAFRKAMESKEVQEKVEKAGRPLDPAYGEDVAAGVRAALRQSPETIAMLKEAMKTEKKDKGP